MTGYPHLSFRQWLVKQVVALRWTAPPNATLAEISQTLGVTVDVLEEARVAREQEMKRLGRTPTSGRKRALFRTDYALARVVMPPEIMKVWREYLAVLGITSSALLRSLVHHFLLAPARPRVISKYWQYQGQIYKNTDERGHASIAEARTSITRGAEVALMHHASLWGIKALALMRGLVTELLEGRVTKLRIVAYSELWGDPDRYLHPEKFSR
jgi:hypothetical protein